MPRLDRLCLCRCKEPVYFLRILRQKRRSHSADRGEQVSYCSPLHSVYVLLVSLLVLVNLLVDVTYASLDPRIPYQYCLPHNAWGQRNGGFL